jgi:hypothetical protein
MLCHDNLLLKKKNTHRLYFKMQATRLHGIENLRKVTKDTKRGIGSRKSEEINYVLSI